MKFYPFNQAILILALWTGSAVAQVISRDAILTPGNSAVKTDVLPLADLREGMRGTARTVFRGSIPEEFNVEILGVVPGAIGPRQDLIVGRISGGSADRTSVFAGMSGSPVFVSGKLVGAISYSFPFSKEPICGITPIEQMITIFERNSGAASPARIPRAVSIAELSSPLLKSFFPNSSLVASSTLSTTNSRLAAVAGQSFQPIATPISFSGFSQETLNFFTPQLLQFGLLPVASAGGGARITPMKSPNDETLLGGTSVSMQLTRGDFSMAASGTVTLRDGEKIYAFGHPFLSLGSSDLPMSESHVVTVVPSVSNSFKLAVPDALVGAMTQDRGTGVFGQLGLSPKMIPVTLNLRTSRNQSETYAFEIAKDDFLTALLLNITVFNAIVSNERGVGDSTIGVNADIKLRGNDPVRIERKFTGGQATQFAAGSIAVPLSAILRSGFPDAEIQQININLTSEDGEKTATLERIVVDHTEIQAGESLGVQAHLRKTTGELLVEKFQIAIPKDTPSGTLQITVADGNSIQTSLMARQFVPTSLRDLVKTLNDLKKNDKLYVQLQRVTNGAIIGANELPNLPPSVLATLSSERNSGGFSPIVTSTYSEKEVVKSEFVISGSQSVNIQVKNSTR